MGRRRRARYPRRRTRAIGGGGGFRRYASRGMSAFRSGGGRALRALRAEKDRTKDRLIAAAIAGGWGLMEKNGVLNDVRYKLFDDHTHTVALVSAAGAMLATGSMRRACDHVANAMVPISAYKLGKSGFDPEGDGFIDGFDDGED